MKYIGLILLSFYLITAQATSGTIDEPLTDLHRPVIVTQSAPMVVFQLPSNPSTGYQWILVQYDHHLLEPILHVYHSANKKLLGPSGYSVWQFKVKEEAFVVPQQASISLHYIRPWEVSPIQKRTIHIVTATQGHE